MKRDMIKILGIRKPSDGYTEEEGVIADLLCNNVVEELYGKLPTSRMKAIVAMHFELGYDTYTLGKIFKVEQPQIALDIHNIKKVLLNKPYKPHKRKMTFEVHDIIWLMLQLQKD